MYMLLFPINPPPPHKVAGFRAWDLGLMVWHVAVVANIQSGYIPQPNVELEKAKSTSVRPETMI